MTAKTEVYSCVETELINLVCKSPAILNKLREVLSDNQFKALSREEPESSVSRKIAEEQIGNIEIRFEDDSTIIVKTLKRAAIPYDCRQLGFRNNRAKGWKFFAGILESETHNFNFGAAYSYPDGSCRNRIKNRAYDAGWKLCNDLCKKLMLFFEREYNFNFPSGFKLYEKNPSGPAGTRRFKFKIRKPSADSFEWSSEISGKNEEKVRLRYSGFDEAELRNEIIGLNSDFSQDSMVHNAAPDHLILAFKVGKKIFGWSDDTMKNILHG